MNPYKMYLSTEHIHEPSNMPAATTATTIGGDPHKFGFCINIGILAGWYCCYQRSFFISCKGKVPVCVGFYSNKAVNKFFLLNLNELKCKTFYSVHFDKSWNIPLPDVQILQIYFSEHRIYSFDKLLYKGRKKKINNFSTTNSKAPSEIQPNGKPNNDDDDNDNSGSWIDIYRDKFP